MQLNQYIELIISPVKFYNSLSVRSLFVESGYHTTYQEACLKLKLVMPLFCSHTSDSADRKSPNSSKWHSKPFVIWYCCLPKDLSLKELALLLKLKTFI